jgi:predicted unusual protein kinase regulating ubiquinone biosynthesis (AarF/ABC1/UbiB family)
MALFARMALFFACMALVFTGLATGAKVMQLFAAICIIFQPVATAREIIANCQELARCIKMIFMEINRIIDFFLDLFPDLQRVHAGREQRRPTSSSTSSRIFKNYTLAEIKDYTNNFDLALLIGQGASGKVYKGKLHDGREVAVKRLQDGLRRAQDTSRKTMEWRDRIFPAGARTPPSAQLFFSLSAQTRTD